MSIITGLAFCHALDGAVHWRKDDPAPEVGDDIWLGHMDFLVGPCEQFPEGAMIEHKATVNFRRQRGWAASPGARKRGWSPQVSIITELRVRTPVPGKVRP